MIAVLLLWEPSIISVVSFFSFIVSRVAAIVRLGLPQVVRLAATVSTCSCSQLILLVSYHLGQHLNVFTVHPILLDKGLCHFFWIRSQIRSNLFPFAADIDVYGELRARSPVASSRSSASTGASSTGRAFGRCFAQPPDQVPGCLVSEP